MLLVRAGRPGLPRLRETEGVGDEELVDHLPSPEPAGPLRARVDAVAVGGIYDL